MNRNDKVFETITVRQLEIIFAIVKSKAISFDYLPGSLGKLYSTLGAMRLITDQLDLAVHVAFDTQIVAIAHSLPHDINASYGEIMDIMEGFFDDDNIHEFKKMREQFGHHE